MTKAYLALCSEVWAITPDWLQVIAALALRDRNHPLVQNAYRADDDNGPRKIPTPAENFAKIVHFGAATRSLEGQGTGRAVVSEGVAILPVLGPIFPRANLMTDMSGATSYAAIQKDLAAALNSDDVHSILHIYDTPGGTVSACAACGDAIMGARGKKPMAAHVLGNMASAGYWLGSSSERISLDRTSMVGSIGVVVGMSKQVQPDARGEMHLEIVSSNAPNKRPDGMSEEGVAEVRRNLDSVEALFISDVARGRGVDAAKVIADFGKGGMLVGSEAVAAGMADSVESFEAAFNRMVRIGKVSRTRQAAGG